MATHDDFYCQECGHHFRTIAGAEKAMCGPDGCPKCGGSDIDQGEPEPRGDHPLGGMGFGIDYANDLAESRRLK